MLFSFHTKALATKSPSIVIINSRQESGFSEYMLKNLESLPDIQELPNVPPLLILSSYHFFISSPDTNSIFSISDSPEALKSFTNFSRSLGLRVPFNSILANLPIFIEFLDLL